MRCILSASVKALRHETFPLVGTLDLSQVRAKAGGHPLRLVCFSIEGRGFLRHMVRRIAGTPALPPHHPESRVEDTPNRQSPQWVNAHTHAYMHTYIHTYMDARVQVYFCVWVAA